MASQINDGPRLTGFRLNEERRGKILYLLLGIGSCFFGGICLLLREGLPKEAKRLTFIVPEIFFLLAMVIGFLFALYMVCLLPAARTKFGRLAVTQSQGCSLKQLFAEIDRDLLSESQRFGPMDISNDWVVGQGPMRIEEICGAFALEISEQHWVLCLMDTGSRAQMTSLEKEDAKAVQAYLHASYPSIAMGEMEEYINFLEQDPAYRYRRRPRGRAGQWSGKLAFWGLDSVPTSVYSFENLQEVYECLEAGQTTGFTLIEPQFLENCLVTGMFLEQQENECMALTVTCEDDHHLFRRVTQVSGPQGIECLKTLHMTGKLPDFSRWNREEWGSKATVTLRLYVDSKKYDYVTWEDVSAAAEGMFEGRYESFSLIHTNEQGGGLFADCRRDGYAVMTAIFQAREYQWKQTMTTRKDQILFWFSNFFKDAQFPYCNDWRDVTDKMDRDNVFAGKL